jgi:hypothetical protein
MRKLLAAVGAILAGQASTQATHGATIQQKSDVTYHCRAGATEFPVVCKSDMLVYESRWAGRVEATVEDGTVTSTGFSGGGETQAVSVGDPRPTSSSSASSERGSRGGTTSHRKPASTYSGTDVGSERDAATILMRASTRLRFAEIVERPFWIIEGRPRDAEGLWREG